MKKIPTNSIRRLTQNLRNTVEISNVLGIIRNQLMTFFNLSQGFNKIIPLQEPGHYIHGPKPRLFVINGCNLEDIMCTIDCELESLCVTNTQSDYKNIALVFNEGCNITSYVGSSWNWKAVLKGVLQNWERYKAAGFNKLYNAAEWSSVIAILDNSTYSRDHFGNLLSYLYLTMSRARVYYSIILTNKPREQDFPNFSYKDLTTYFKTFEFPS